jgi:heterodisulfide reductase subunit C
MAHVATGDMLRAHLRDGTDLGLRAKAFMEAGELVPDELVIEMLVDRLGGADARAGVLLDGFPRTIAQAEALDAALAAGGAGIDGLLVLDVPEDEIRMGAGTLTDMTWKQMVDTATCTECGRCQDVCPAYATGKELSPKLLIMGLRDHLLDQGPKLLSGADATDAVPLVPNAVTDDVVWDCVTCGACVHECPVSIEHIDHIVDLRRQLVMVDARFPAEADPMLRDVERSSNPWGKAQSERAAWAEGLGVRVLEPGDPERPGITCHRFIQEVDHSKWPDKSLEWRACPGTGIIGQLPLLSTLAKTYAAVAY